MRLTAQSLSHLCSLRGENESKLAMSEAVDIWCDEFDAICRAHGLELRTWAPREAEISEAFAAQFVISFLRRSRGLRWRFPRALQDGAEGGFARWLQAKGERRLGLSPMALKKIRGVFRRQPGRRIYDVYLQDRELQRLFPLGLTPVGQRNFLGWLMTFGRTDQNVQDHEVLWFLHECAEAVGEGIALSYRVNPSWQELFPDALTPNGWRPFIRKLESLYPDLHKWQRQLRNASDTVPRPAVGGVNILSHFCYPSGIQQAAVWTREAIERAGLTTSCRDVPAGIKTTLLPRIDWLGLEAYPVTIITVAPTPYFATAYERSGWFRKAGVYRIAYWAWELETIPEEWVAMLPLVDEIWAPTEFVARAMRTRMTVPVHRMLPGVEVGEFTPVSKSELGIPDDHFVFLFMFDMYSDAARKNPLAVIRAFCLAFSSTEKAILVIKTTSGSPDPIAAERLEAAASTAGVVLLRETLPRAKAYGLIEMCDCFVSLHRSEGFGLGLAEAMLFGKPVIATGYSGNLDFMTEHNSLLVDYKLVPTRDSGPLYTSESVWAEPSEQHAAAQMRRLFDDRVEAAAIGARAQAELRETLSLRAGGERMRERLRQIMELRKL